MATKHPLDGTESSSNAGGSMDHSMKAGNLTSLHI